MHRGNTRHPAAPLIAAGFVLFFLASLTSAAYAQIGPDLLPTIIPTSLPTPAPSSGPSPSGGNNPGGSGDTGSTGGTPSVPPTPKLSPVPSVSPSDLTNKNNGLLPGPVNDLINGHHHGDGGGGTNPAGNGGSGGSSGSGSGTGGNGGGSSQHGTGAKGRLPSQAVTVPVRGSAGSGVPHSYGAMAGRAATTAAGRVLNLAGPLAPPLIVAAAMLLLLASLGRGSDRFGKFDSVTSNRAYRL